MCKYMDIQLYCSNTDYAIDRKGCVITDRSEGDGVVLEQNYN